MEKRKNSSDNFGANVKKTSEVNKFWKKMGKNGKSGNGDLRGRKKGTGV